MSVAAELKELMVRKPRLTLAVAESLTAGHVQAGIASVSGASDFFLGGITVYTLAQKVKLLGVNRAHAARVDCVSQRVAVEMAIGVASRFGSNLAVATTGYAEASPANKIKTPMAWWALAHRRRGAGEIVVSGYLEIASGGRIEVQERIAELVLMELVRYLREVRG
jgi:nicotinamide-nucleotide amidase